MSALMGILSLLASVTGLLLAIIQTIRLRELKRRDVAALWEVAFTCRKVVGNIENSELAQTNAPIAKAYTQAISIHEKVLKFLILRERSFSRKTLEEWKSLNKITNSWQEKQALKYLDQL